MRRLLVILALGTACVASAAQACSLCEEEEANPMTAYIDYRGMTPEQQRAADAKAAAEARESAMNQARAVFITRFLVRSTPSPSEVAQAPAQAAEGVVLAR